MRKVDIATVVTEGGYADWALDESGDLLSEYGVTTSALHSVFTDARVRDSDPHPGDRRTDPRGWWADKADSEIGSRLWLLSRRKATPDTRSEAEGYLRECLQWLVDEDLVTDLRVSSEWVRGGRLNLLAELVRGDARRWPSAWTATPRPVDVGGKFTVTILARG